MTRGEHAIREPFLRNNSSLLERNKVKKNHIQMSEMCVIYEGKAWH